ncbi:MAG: hypothetical protein OH354_01635 [Candidatus Parvarchaeota archaeon]|nr:hypothetical protein [Candidatus Jingweiarchaeum tengchongense]MCW1300100.1 hypothetical protein [Candidatus Jingweiarchaeum tengchongense]MCW1304454.1 hypothetical protein [Candidatus Jingweiarchaeum tengchongense]MCW1305621.1 hypothetical protein [Candidatus Jingweiarchaeum tengchongense]MCW1309258.1 hypothetical protein [Candidatus Jingweiarchaeum tengchongense]
MVTSLSVKLKNGEKLEGILIGNVDGALVLAIDPNKIPKSGHEILEKESFPIIVPNSVYVKIPYEQMQSVRSQEMTKEDEDLLPSLIESDKRFRRGYICQCCEQAG